MKACNEYINMLSLNESLMMENPGSLITIISEGRSIEATLEDQSTVHTEGGQMSSRIPIRLKSEDGRVEEGPFTDLMNTSAVFSGRLI